MLASAWLTLGHAIPNQISTLVEQSIWFRRDDLHWRQNDVLGWVNDGAYTLRNGFTSNKKRNKLFAFLQAVSAA